MAYDNIQIAQELQATAMGETYYGNALRVAKDIPGLTDDEIALLDRWADGSQTAQDGWDLQDLANRVRAGIEPAITNDMRFKFLERSQGFKRDAKGRIWIDVSINTVTGGMKTLKESVDAGIRECPWVLRDAPTKGRSPA